MKQHIIDPTAIVLPKVVMAFKSQAGYHTFTCPACDQRNKVHEKRAMNYVPADPTKNRPKEAWKGASLHFSCVGCHREVHVDRCPEGGLIVL